MGTRVEEPYTREVKSSKWYEENASVDMWQNIGVEEVPAERSSTMRGERVIEPEEDHKYVVRVPKLSFSDRLAILLGDQVPVEVVDQFQTFSLEDWTPTLSELERKKLREWLLAPETTGPVQPSPTDRELKQQADDMVLKANRTHNPDLIEAIKNLPDDQVIEIKIPRSVTLTHQQKCDIQRLVNALVNGSYTAKPKKSVEAAK
jgi:hypothetical protein